MQLKLYLVGKPQILWGSLGAFLVLASIATKKDEAIDRLTGHAVSNGFLAPDELQVNTHGSCSTSSMLTVKSSWILTSFTPRSLRTPLK